MLTLAAHASATPVCTDGYMNGPPASLCGGRIFPEAAQSQAYVQYTPNPQGFSEYRHGLEYLAQKYPRWISVFTLEQRYGDVRRRGKLYAVVDLRKLKGKSLVLNITRRTTSGRLVKTKHTRLVCK